MNKKTKLFLVILGLCFSVTTNAGVFETLRTVKQASDVKGMYDTVQSIRTVKGMENSAAIYTKVKRFYISADLKPKEGDAAKMNVLVQEVLCDNVERIVDNLEKYDLEGAAPKCKTGMADKSSKKKMIQMTVSQSGEGPPFSIVATSTDQENGQVLKTFKIEGAENYKVAVEKLVDDIHGDLVLSSRTNNPLSQRKWPSRFKKYSKKNKHRQVEMKRKQRKQLEANAAK